MNIAPQKLMTIIVLAAVLFAGIVAYGVIMTFRGAADGEDASTISDLPEATESVSVDTTTGFNTTVLQGSAYGSLDVGLVTQGRLPVQPPTAIGKPNPF